MLKMKRFFTLYRTEQKLFFRNTDVFIFNLCMPVVTLFLIGIIAGGKMAGDTNMTYLQSSYAAICAVGICCSAFMSIPIVVVDYRDKKILKRLYCSPCSPFRLLMADVMCSGVMASLSAICVSIVAWLVLGYRMQGNVFIFIGTWFLTMISMFSIGLLAAGLCKNTRILNVVTSVLYFPMLLFSGATIPFELFPKGMQMVAKWMPLSIGIRIMKVASMGNSMSDRIPELLGLFLIAVVCTCVATKTFQWE